MSVTLDTTLHDLYSLDSDSHHVAFIYSHPSGHHAPKSTRSPPPKQFPMFPCGLESLAVEWAELRALAQRYAFVAGQMPVVLVDDASETSPNSPAISDANHSDALRGVKQLTPQQTPQLLFASSIADIKLDRRCSVAVARPDDSLAHLRHVICWETLYVLLSKRWLARSGLPTPRAVAVDPSTTVPCSCDTDALEREIDSMLQPLDHRALPFVVKTSVGHAGRGTFCIHTERDRQAAKQQLRDYLRKMLPQITLHNNHLYPASLVIQDLIPGKSCGISLFVTKRGAMTLIGVAAEEPDSAGNYRASVTSYRDPVETQMQPYMDTAEKLATRLHRAGYYGPVGADVMTGSSGERYIVDVNPRVTATYHLGFLRGHFTRRGLYEAAVLAPLFVRSSRDAFERHFGGELRAGRLIITGWSHGNHGETGIAGVTFGGEDIQALNDLIDRVEVYARETP